MCVHNCDTAPFLSGVSPKMIIIRRFAEDFNLEVESKTHLSFRFRINQNQYFLSGKSNTN